MPSNAPIGARARAIGRKPARAEFTDVPNPPLSRTSLSRTVDAIGTTPPRNARRMHAAHAHAAHAQLWHSRHTSCLRPMQSACAPAWREANTARGNDFRAGDPRLLILDSHRPALD